MLRGGEKIVISGISGVFPESDNVEEFKENLFAKKDLTTLDNRRWNTDKFKGPSKIGKIKTLSKFDHSFFRVHRKHANGATPASRILFEKTYEAIVDAGYNPEHLKGSKTGVYIGIGFNDWEDSAAIAGLEVNESFVTGKSRSVIANRISYWLDINGPSYAIDTACSSSLYALECAYSDIQDGKCDAAIVGAFNLCLLSYMNEAYTNMGILSKNNLSKPFDAEADGFVRSQAVAVVFLQKEKDARRRYANVINIKTSCDWYKEEGLAYPSGKSHKQLYKGLYQDINLDPQKVSYIEAHGTATTIGDIVEINALEEFFCANRQDPLKIGSVKSNMGHSEACAGLCSLIKMIISFESGLIPPNINLQTLNRKINGFHNGKVEVITDVTRCEGEFFGINSFGVGGANAHLLVSPNPVTKKKNSQPNEIPCLVTLSGRTEEAVNVLAQDVEKNYTDPEYIRLLHEIFKDNINGHLYRGYSIVHKDRAPTKFIQNFTQEERPIWYILTGMGSQWSQMGKNLMKIPEFAQSIHRSNRLLETVGVNLIEILTDKNPQIFDNVLNSFIGITAIQVALIDILQMLQIKPDGIIGHSVGELGCAYADGCLTAEQTVLCAYYRGLVLANNKSYRGTIAAVAQKYEDLIQSLPDEIDLACYNGAQTYAISGPSEMVENYVKDVQQKGIFALEIDSSHIAFHSRYIAPAGPDLLYHLKKVISYPQLRSKKWICTSVLEDQWNTNKAKYSSAEYFVDNLISPVYFEQALCHIPNNAIVIEIAPHGLLQALLKRSLPPTVDNIPLISKYEKDTVFYLLNSIGKLYTIGLTSNLSTLYPPIHFPVSRGTPMISPLIRWLHDEEWFVPQEQEQNIKSGERTVIINGKKDFEYLRGHIIDDRNLFPAAGYIILIWETIAMMNDKPYTQLPVVFDQVCFLRATTIPEEGVIRLHISVQPGTGTFEITESRAVVVSGRVYIPDDPCKEIIKLSNVVSETQALTMSTKDIYKALRLRGYHYQGIFKAVTGSTIDNTLSKVSWTNNFIAFLDTMTHPILLTQDTNELMIPTFDRKIVIDPKKHFNILETLDKEKPEFSIRIDQKQKIIRAGGIDIYGMKFVEIARRRDMSELVLEKYQFVPNFSKLETDIKTSITLCTHIVLENLQITKVKSIEFLQRQDDVGCPLSPIVLHVLNNLPLIQANISIISDDESHLEELNHDEINIENKKLPSDKSCTMLIVTNILKKLNTIPNLLNALKDNGFIIAQEQIIQDQSFQNSGLDICFARIVGKEKILLLRKASPITKNPIIIKLDNFSYPWISQLKESISKLDSESGRKLIIYAEKEPLSEIIGFFNCIRKEPKGDHIRCFFLMDKSAPKFSLDNPLYKTQFDKNLSHNIYKNGEWGSYRHLLLEPPNDYESLHAYGNVAARGDLSTLKWFEVLESEFQVFLTQQDIKSSTFGKLYSMMENEKRKQSLKDEKVTIVRQESFNKDILHLPIIRIPSLADNGSIKEVNSHNTQTIFVFPGIEGIAKTMEPLGKNINAQLLCLQYRFATPQISFQNFAKKLLPLIADRLAPNQPFYFISFGIGSKIAIEIAKILEEQGHTGNLWIIKRSLDSLEDSFSTRITNTSLQENEMQITVLTKCLNLFVPGVMYNEFVNDVREQKEWESRRNFITMMMSDHTQNEAAIRDLLDYVHWIVKATCTYEFPGQISKTAINLIRTNESTHGEPEDYGFSKHFKTLVRVHRVETDYKSILSHQTTAQIINKGLASSQ